MTREESRTTPTRTRPKHHETQSDLTAADDSPVGLADKIDAMVADVEAWIHRPSVYEFRGVVTLGRPSPSTAESEAEDARLSDLQQRIVKAGRAVAEMLVRHGESATAVLTLTNSVDGSDVKGTGRDWPTIKVALQESAIRLRQRKTADPKTRRRTKREAANATIMKHLMQRPRDTAKDVAEAVECSVGVVGESPAWKANQELLADARRQGREPMALSLREYVNRAGSSVRTQHHDHKRARSLLDEEIEAGDAELFRRIGDYADANPGATPSEIARAVGCMARDIELRQATLDRLASEQAGDAMEDDDQEPKEADGKPWRKQVRKQV